MSLEKTIQENTEAVNRLAVGFAAFAAQVINVVQSPAAGTKAPAATAAPATVTTQAPAAKRKRRTKAEIEAAQATETQAAPAAENPVDDRDPALKEKAKAKCAEVGEKLGKAKLAFLLSCFGAKTFSDVKPGVGVYADLINRADTMIADGDDGGADDLLNDAPDDEKPAPTFEDVKTALEKVADNPELGRTEIKAILSDLGAARLGDLAVDKYAEAIKKAEEILKAVADEVE